MRRGRQGGERFAPLIQPAYVQNLAPIADADDWEPVVKWIQAGSLRDHDGAKIKGLIGAMAIESISMCAQDKGMSGIAAPNLLYWRNRSRPNMHQSSCG